MPEPKNLKLRVCDDVRQSPRGPLIDRVLYNAVPEDLFYVAILFSEAASQAFSIRPTPAPT